MTAREDPSGAGRHSRPRSPVYEVGALSVVSLTICLYEGPRLSRLVDRYGRTGAAAITSGIWFLPMAAWAGSSDLSPIDQTAYPKVALAIGILMLAVWFGLLTRIAKAPVSKRTRRLDLTQMSTKEKRWTLALIAFCAGLIAWFNAAATVDWSPLGPALASGKLGPILFAAALAALLAAMLVGIAVSWRRSTLAYRARKAESTAHLE